MKTHELSILQDFADAIFSGEMTFILRENDRGYQKGDHIKFRVLKTISRGWTNHALKDCEYEITYVLNGWGLKNGCVALAIRRIK